MTSSSQAWKRPKSPSAGARSLISHLQPGQKIVPVGRGMYDSLCQAGKRGYSAWVVEIHEKEHPQYRKPRRSRDYRMRSG